MPTWKIIACPSTQSVKACSPHSNCAGATWHSSPRSHAGRAPSTLRFVAFSSPDVDDTHDAYRFCQYDHCSSSAALALARAARSAVTDFDRAISASRARSFADTLSFTATRRRVSVVDGCCCRCRSNGSGAVNAAAHASVARHARASAGRRLRRTGAIVLVRAGRVCAGQCVDWGRSDQCADWGR